MNKSSKRTAGNFSVLLAGVLYMAVAIALTAGLPGMAKAAKGEVGGLQKGATKGGTLINVVLTGATEYELTEMFNDLIMQTPGVVEAKRYRLRLEPDNPGACVVVWQVRVEDLDAFQLESALYQMLRQSEIEEDGVENHAFSVEPTVEHLALFRHIRPWHASSRELHFVLERPGKPTPLSSEWHRRGKGSWRSWPNAGFE